MSSRSNVPEWFGGDGARPSSSSSSKTKRSSSSSSRRSSSRKSTSSADGTSPNRTSKRKSHKRRKSREVNMADVLDGSGGSQSTSKTSKSEGQRTNGKNSTGKISKSPPKIPENTAAATISNKVLETPAPLEKKPSFVQRIFGFGSSNTSKGDDSFKVTDDSDSLDIERKKSAVPSRQTMDDTAIHTTTTTSQSQEQEQSSTPPRYSHRRVYSDVSSDHNISVSAPADIFRHSPPANMAGIQSQTSFPPTTTRMPPTAQFTHQLNIPLKMAAKQGYTHPLNAPLSEERKRELEKSAEFSGTESEELVYSEDESTSAIPKTTYPIQSRNERGTNVNYPYQQPYTHHERNEHQQLLEQQRLMALAPDRYPRAPYMQQYGALDPRMNMDGDGVNSPVNEFYISEDETLMSESSRRRTWKDDFRDRRSFRGLQENDHAIPEEDEDNTESTSLLASPKPIPQESSFKSNTSNGSSGERKSVTIATPPSVNGGNLSPSSDERPPPIQSLSIETRPRSIMRMPSTGTATTSGTTAYHTLSTRNMSRKEMRKLSRRIEIEVDRSERIQAVTRSGHIDALDWSMHVPQLARGQNFAAGFFPTEERKAHDIPFAFLFLCQIGIIIYIAVIYGGSTVMLVPSADTTVSPYTESDPFNINTDDPFSSSVTSKWDEDIRVDYSNAFQLACITALYATSLSALFVGMMMILGKALILTILSLFMIICIGFGSVGFAFSPFNFIPIIGFVALFMVIAYTSVVYERIPFASVNLDTALQGIKASADVLAIAILMMFLAFGWTIVWVIAFLGVYDQVLSSPSMNVEGHYSYKAILIYSGMLLSFIWTLNVGKNIIHVTVAGVIASWWADPDNLHTCCNSVLRENFGLSLTSSFGSICLGSLVSPTLTFAKNTISICNLRTTTSHELGKSSRGIGEQSVLSDPSNLAQLPIITSPFDGAIKYFNDYGFTFIGLFREKFSESSRKATEIFEIREWVGVVHDQMIEMVMNIIIILITAGTGLLGLVIEEFDDYSFTSLRQPTTTAFLIGCFVGNIISQVCIKVIKSAVKTVYVCFALAPLKFHENHQALSKEMRKAWGGVWLDEYEDLVPISESNSIDRGETIAPVLSNSGIGDSY